MVVEKSHHAPRRIGSFWKTPATVALDTESQQNRVIRNCLYSAIALGSSKAQQIDDEMKIEQLVDVGRLVEY